MRACQASVASTTASAPSSMVWGAGRAAVRAPGETVARERAGCVWRCACELQRAVGVQRPHAHSGSSCANASSASIETPVIGHYSGGRRAGATRATDVHPPATAALTTAEEAVRARARCCCSRKLRQAVAGSERRVAGTEIMTRLGSALGSAG
jgi:hypothetical protein